MTRILRNISAPFPGRSRPRLVAARPLGSRPGRGPARALVVFTINLPGRRVEFWSKKEDLRRNLRKSPFCVLFFQQPAGLSVPHRTADRQRQMSLHLVLRELLVPADYGFVDHLVPLHHVEDGVHIQREKAEEMYLRQQVVVGLDDVLVVRSGDNKAVELLVLLSELEEELFGLLLVYDRKVLVPGGIVAYPSSRSMRNLSPASPGPTGTRASALSATAPSGPTPRTQTSRSTRAT